MKVYALVIYVYILNVYYLPLYYWVRVVRFIYNYFLILKFFFAVYYTMSLLFIYLCQGCASAGNDSVSRAARPLTGSRRQKAMDHHQMEIRNTGRCWTTWCNLAMAASAAPAGVAAASAAPAGAAVAPVGRPCPL